MRRKRKSITIAALLVGMILIMTLPITAAEPLRGPRGHSKVDGTLQMLITAGQDLAAKGQIGADTELGQVLAQAARTGMIPVYMVFHQPLDRDQVRELERDGVVFHRFDGDIIHVGRVYSADVPTDRIEAIAADPLLELIESAWKPGLTPPLDLTVPDINADQVWSIRDSLGRSMTGHGIVIADLDTGVDVFHPALFKADGGTFDWIDDNGSGGFEAGLDYVDLNGNATADANEILRFIDASHQGVPWPIPLPDTNDGVFRATMDWLYNDANNDSQRNYGPAAGFVEASPTFGEQLFIVEDANGNDLLDVGETLLAQSTSKVLATRDATNTAHTRGVDLIQSQDDTNGHGTSVNGILAANVYDHQKYVGVSPDAELLVADIYGGNYLASIAWAQAQGADIILHEIGGWVQHFMDGSSAIEQALDAAAVAGIVQVVPSGNLAGHSKHAQTDINDGDTDDFPFNVVANRNWVWLTVLWRDTGNNLDFALTEPGGAASTDLPDTGSGSVAVGGDTAMYARTDSSRGTARYDISINGSPVASGAWTLHIGNSDGADETVHAFAKVNGFGWTGGIAWGAFATDESTMTWPSTADHAITVANYHPPGRAWPAGSIGGDLTGSSGRGPRIDGARTVDIAAPGNWTMSIESKDERAVGDPIVLGKYNWFSGTSASGPHVAGAAALMLQHHPGWNHTTVRQHLEDTARSDGFTGVTPNDDWGHGKLDAYAAADPTGITVDNDPVIVDEGDTATNTGTYSVRPGGTVTLGASVGTITDGGGGLWSWSFDTTDGPDDSQTVTVTATDDEGNVAQATFELQVNNVAPTVTVDTDPVVVDEGYIATNSGTYFDPGDDTITLSASAGTIIDNGDGTWDWSLQTYDGPDDSQVVTITATDSDGDSGTADFDLEVNNVAPVVTAGDPSPPVQYSDYICPVTFTATDVAADTMTASIAPATQWDSLSVVPGSCTTSPDGIWQTCTWTLEGTIDEPVGDYLTTVMVADEDSDAGSADTTITVLHEDADIWLEPGNPVAVEVDTPGGDSLPFSLTAYVQETTPDEAICGPDPGDISDADVSISLVPVGPDGTVTEVCVQVGVTGTGYDAVLEVRCDFDDVPVNTYYVQATVVGDYYVSGTAEEVLVVFDPSLGFTTGGGWFYWPGTDEKTTLGYEIKYNKKQKNIKGNLLIIRHMEDGSIYRVKSNALHGLAIGDLDSGGDGWASFAGKCTYIEPGWPEPLGNYRFIVYVEDWNEPGAGHDKFWLEITDRALVPDEDMSMGRPGHENTVTIIDGNIVVPHTPH